VQLGSCFPAQDLAITCCTANQQMLCGSQVPIKM
jgi:hypothetical protein